MLKTSVNYLTAIPRYSVAMVFLWFGLDKFINFQYYLSWFSATQSIKILLPFSADLSIHILGIIEITICILLFLGIKTRILSIVVIVFLMTILATAKYPSSFPQDIGLIGITLMIFLTHAKSSNSIKNTIHYLWMPRFSLAIVLSIWAIDYLVNYERHQGWLHLASALFSRFDSSGLFLVVLTVAAIELSLASMFILNLKTKYLSLAAIGFFVFAIFGLDMPASNHQSLCFAVISGWLLLCSYQKANPDQVKDSNI